MRRFILYLLLPLLLFAGQAWGATYTVTQSGSGADYSIAQFNALTGTSYAGDTFYFSGTITSTISVTISGTSGGGDVVLDGYQAGDCDPINSECTSSALIDHSSTFGIWNGSYSTGQNYITIQDFRVTNVIHGMYFTAGSSHLTFKRNYVHDCEHAGIRNTHGSGYTASYVTIGGASGDGNKITNCGQNDGENLCLSYFVNDLIVSYNKMGIDDKNTYGREGLYIYTCNRVLIEYNTVYDIDIASGGGEQCISAKGLNSDVIIRFNDVSGANGNGIHVVNYNQDFYVYGNRAYDNGGAGIGIGTQNTLSWEGGNSYPENIHVFSNLLYDNESWGVYTSLYGCSVYSCTLDKVYIYNNTIVGNGGYNYQSSGFYCAYGTNIYFKNNILSNNVSNSAEQEIWTNNSTNITLGDNLYYDATGAATLTGISMEGDATEADPKFVNTAASDYTLLGTSPALDAGTDLSGCFNVTIQGSNYPICYDDALDPNLIDWTTTPPTVVTKKQDDYTPWERGAYVYVSGQSAPVATIDTPASDITDGAIDDEITLAGSYTDVDGDTCTYTWVIGANLFKAWVQDATYAVGDLVENANGSGSYYRCTVAHTDDTGDKEPPNASYWEDAEAVASPGTGTVDAAATYTVTLKVNDGTVDSTTKSRSITVLSGGGTPATEEVWSKNSGADYDIGDVTYLQQQSPTTAGGSYEYTGARKADSWQYKGGLIFDLSDINGETVSDAQLELYLTDAPGTTGNIELWSCSNAFVEATATWNTYDGTNAWTGTHGQDTMLAEVEFSSSSTLNQYYTWQSDSLTSYIGTIASSGGVARFILAGDTYDSGGGVWWKSDDDSDDSARPKLTISYGAGEGGSVPAITSITTNSDNKAYKADDSIGPFYLNLSEPCDVTGTPVMTFETGDSDATSNYSSGSGTAQLTFAAFTVAAGYTTADLDVTGITTTDAAIAASDDAEALPETDDAIDTVPTGATTGSLASAHAIVIDTTVPAAASVVNDCTDCTGDDTYTDENDEIIFGIETGEDNLIIYAAPGYPRIATNIGWKHTVYAEAAGLCSDDASVILMRVIVQPGMRIDAYNFTGDLDLGPGGKITDAAGNIISTDMGEMDLVVDTAAAIEIACPYDTDNKLVVGTGGDYANLQAAGDATWDWIDGDYIDLQGETHTLTGEFNAEAGNVTLYDGTIDGGQDITGAAENVWFKNTAE